jgi:hypothetical protein
MPRFFTPSRILRMAFAAVVAICLVAGVLPHRTLAAGSKQLQRVSGTVGWSTVANAGDFKEVFGKFDLPDDDFAVTKPQSKAVLAMPDSSLISLGENTSIQVGAFNTTAAGPGATITVNSGTLRFEVKRPEGGAANYHFTTPTSQVAVRGTVGLLAFTNGITTVGCVVCAADSVVVTTATQTVALVTGQFITVSALGVITTGALGGVVGAFGAAGVPTTAVTGAAAAGIPAAAAGIAIPVAAGAAAAGVAIGVASSTHPSPTPQPTATASTGPNPNPTPSGSVNLTGTTHAPAPAAASAHPPAAAPLAAPAPAPPAATTAKERFGR